MMRDIMMCECEFNTRAPSVFLQFSVPRSLIDHNMFETLYLVFILGSQHSVYFQMYICGSSVCLR